MDTPGTLVSQGVSAGVASRIVRLYLRASDAHVLLTTLAAAPRSLLGTCPCLPALTKGCHVFCTDIIFENFTESQAAFQEEKCPGLTMALIA